MTNTLRLFLVLTGSVLVSNASANTLCVNTAVLSCYPTVQAAINAAAPGDTINIAAGTYTENLSVTKALTLNGAGSSSTILDGGNVNRVITINASNPSDVVNISNVTIQHGRAFIHGGGIANGDGSTPATLNLSSCVVTANHAGHYGGGGSNQVGGGIYNRGALSVVNCTISNNSSNGDAGGVAVLGGTAGTIVGSTITGNTAGDTECCGFGGGVGNGGTTAIVNSTISGNTSYAGQGGGIGSDGAVSLSFTTLTNNSGGAAGGIMNYGAATIKNSIVAGNTGGPECGYIPVISVGGNFSTSASCGVPAVTLAALNLGTLQVNAPGTTATQSLASPSVALDAAVDCKDAAGATVTTDQRGMARPQGAACDSGAFELFVAPTIASVSAQITTLVATLGAGTVNDLLTSLSAANASIAKGNTGAAANQLGAFINKVQALQKSRRLDDATANTLVGAAQHLIAHL
jgi:hypothetical protein